MSQEEQWRQVEDADYEVSDQGRIRRKSRGNILKQRGYKRVQFHIGGKGRVRMVHQLVAKAFIGPAPSSEHHINHKNGDHGDNRVENLEWLTPRENQLHAIEQGFYEGRGESHGRAKLTDRKVLEIRRRYTGAYGQQSQMAREYGVTQGLIAKIVHGAVWTHLEVRPITQSEQQDKTGAHLNAEQVREIRNRYVGGYGQQTAFAKEYGVTTRVISGIVKGETWKNVGVKRTGRGQHHGRAKLNNRQVKQARKRYDAGTATAKVLATQYGMDRRTMLNIVTRKTWQHVP